MTPRNLGHSAMESLHNQLEEKKTLIRPTDIAIAFSAFLVFVLVKFLYDHVLRPQWYLRRLRGPPRTSFLVGNMAAVTQVEPGITHRAWHNEHGTTFRYDGPLTIPRLCTTDKRALHHIFVSEAYKFPKPDFLRKLLVRAVGEGVLIVEGDDHKRQRKIINPSFGPAHLKSIYPVFIEKSYQLCSTILSQIPSRPSPTSPFPSSTSSATLLQQPQARVDMYEYANRATLDVIGSAGFGYEINAITHGNENDLVKAFNSLFGAIATLNVWVLLTGLFPFLQNLPFSHVRAATHAKSVIDRIGSELVEQKKRDVILESSSTTGGSGEKAGEVKASGVRGKDLLSILVKANMAADLKASQRMSDKDVAAQISTFLLAGNDTTANAISWAIYALCKYPDTQHNLRDELLSFRPSSSSSDSVNVLDAPTYDELNALPYLEAVIRETLRLYAPVQGTSRQVLEDCIIPLSEGWVDNKGVRRNEIFVPRNTSVFIPIAHINTNISTWGPTALDFEPSRWLPENQHTLPEGVMEMPSIAFPTFLAGPRACIGFRFTLLEMKTMLFALIRELKFELADPVEEIEARNSIVTRPRIRTRVEEGWQLPVLVSAVLAEA